MTAAAEAGVEASAKAGRGRAAGASPPPKASSSVAGERICALEYKRVTTGPCRNRARAAIPRPAAADAKVS